MRLFSSCRGRRHAEVTPLAAGLAVLAALAAALSGCSASVRTVATTGPATIVDNLIAATVPADIRSDGVLTVGVDPAAVPAEFLAGDGKTVKGFDIDLFDAIAAKLGLQARYVPAKQADIVGAVAAGTYEVGASSITITEERKKAAIMVSYFRAGTRWVTQRGNPENIRPVDACGAKVTVQQDTVPATTYLAARQLECKNKSRPEIVANVVPPQSDLLRPVLSGVDHALIADSPVAAYAVKRSNGRLELLGEIDGAAPYGYVVSSAQAEFATAIQSAVKALIAEGTYRKILKKWGVADGAISAPEVNP